MTFSIIDTGLTGAGFSRYWMENIAHNIANVNTVRGGDEEPFRARMVEARALGTRDSDEGLGVAVSDVRDAEGDAPLVFDPNHPLADEAGYVKAPLVDLAGELTNLIQAQRSYQVSLKVIQSGEEAYQSALRIGSGR